MVSSYESSLPFTLPTCIITLLTLFLTSPCPLDTLITNPYDIFIFDLCYTLAHGLKAGRISYLLKKITTVTINWILVSAAESSSCAFSSYSPGTELEVDA